MKFFSSALIVVLCISFSLSSTRVHANEDGDGHEAKAGITTDQVYLVAQSTEQLQKIINILTQVVALMIERNKLLVSGTVNAPVPSHDEHSEEMETHEAEHGDDADMEADADADIGVKLVIEIEAHFDNTHVHMRYVDKPEEMFFVPVDMHDTPALIAAIVAKTGLAWGDVESALKYFE